MLECTEQTLNPISTMRSITGNSRKRILKYLFITFLIFTFIDFAFIILKRLCYERVSNNSFTPQYGGNDNPAVTRDSPQHNLDHDRALDLNYCGYENCKFLFAYYPPSRDDALDSQYTDYIHIARLLGRTMVLTNVGATRIGACQKFPFNFYYDINSLSQRFPDVKFVTQYDFQQWTKLKQQKPVVSHIYITDGSDTNSVETLVPYPDMLKRMWCLDKFGFKLDKTSRFEQLRASWNSWANQTSREEFQSFVISSLQHDEDVLLMRHDVREPLFHEENERMKYASHIMNAAEEIANGLRPYVAIKWNLEHADLGSLNECVQRLLKKVQKSIDRSRIENIYMATDYPLFDTSFEKSDGSDLKSHSITWKYVTPAHHSAIELLKSKVPLNNWVSLKVLDYLGAMLKEKYETTKEMREIKEAIIKTGINHIVEQIVCVRADWFVGFPRFPCNFPLDDIMTKTIIDERSQLFNKGYRDIKNNVTRF